MKKIFISILAILMTLGLTGCVRSGEPKINGQWNTIGLEKDGVAQQIALSYINFQAKGVFVRVNGDAGVNTFNGTAEINKKGSFMADDFAVTKMMGDPVAMEFEDLFLETLSKATSYIIEDNILLIAAPDDGLVLKFVKAE